MITDAPSHAALTEDTVRALGETLGHGPARSEAWKFFAAAPWPRSESEAWRRTDISALEWDRFRLRSMSRGPAKAVPLPFQGTEDPNETGCLWGDEGRYVSGALKGGVELSALSESPRAGEFLGTAVRPRGKFEALSQAFWTQGDFLFVPAKAAPGTLLRLGRGASLKDGELTAHRTVVTVEAGAHLTLIEDDAVPEVPEGGEAVVVGGVELVLGEGAEVRYIHLQRHGRGVRHFFSHHARLAADARLTTLVIGLGGTLTKADFGSELLGPGAESRLYGLVFGEGDQRFTHHTVQDHRAPRTSSDVLFKAALRDTSRSVYTGLIQIEKTAQKTDAHQTSKNILLSTGARAVAIPNLEILTDDVVCGHGAAVGNLDDDQRFYLMSRGLGAAEAERVIVEGFFEEVLEKIPVPGLHDRLRAAIDEKLEGRRG